MPFFYSQNETIIKNHCKNNKMNYTYNMKTNNVKQDAKAKMTQDEKQKMVLEILSLQADLNVPRGNMNYLLKMPDNWLQDCYNSLKEADNKVLAGETYL